MLRFPQLSFRTRAANLEALAREPVDVLIIGGGITGAGLARDAALRGLSVGLVEQRDFASGTSSRSSKLVHGGLRYLQQGDVGLVREAATERYALRKLAPHLAQPHQLLVPVSSRGGYAKISVGLWTYDRLAGVSDDERYRMLSKEETLALEPSLRPDAVYGSGLYYEYLTDDARLVLDVIKSAAALGAIIANHAEVTGFLPDVGRVAGVTMRDRATGAELVARGRVVINATGPWVDQMRLLCEPGETARLRLTKGIHVGVRSERIGLSHIVVMSASDRRGVFAIPRGEVTYLGTTDTDYPQPDEEPVITLADVTYLLDAANSTFAMEQPLDPDDVICAWAGLRPLLEHEGKRPSELSRKDEVMVGDSGLISIAGGKLTTFRRMAERVVDIACDRLKEQGCKLAAPVGASDETLFSGGETGDDVADFTRRLSRRWPEVESDVVERLVGLYGSNAERMVEVMCADPVLADRYAPHLPVTRAEVEYAVRNEMAMTLIDFLERRSRVLLWDPDNGREIAEGVARTMGRMLGWDARRIDEEIARYSGHVLFLKGFQNEEPEAEPARAANG